MDGANFTPPPPSPPPPPGPSPWGHAPPPVPPPALRQVEFVSEGSRFLKLLARGAALNLVTFGFYRFWLATDIRRHLWSHTVIDGENAEYTGAGKELLIGFLFALAILVPIYLVYFLIGIEAERAQAFASVPLALFMMLFGYFALYRARRYRLTRTVWRGVRFWMQGSGWKYAFLAFGWGVLVVLSLGFAYPWRAAALERYKMRNTFYGDLQGGFDARPGDFLRKGAIMWMYFLAVVAIAIAGAALAASSRGRDSLGVGALIAALFGAMALPFVYPYFKALEWRWWASGVHFGGTRVTCDLRGGQLLGLFFKFLVISSLVTSVAAELLLAIGAAVIEIAGIDLKQLNPRSMQDVFSGGAWVVIAGAAFGYLAVLMVAGVVQRFFMQHEYWKLISGAMTVVNPAAMENVAAKGDLAHALGEGLADSLDIAGF